MDACCFWPFLLLLSLANLAELFGGSSGEGGGAHRGRPYPPTVGQQVAYWCLAALGVAFAVELVVFVAFFL